MLTTFASADIQGVFYCSSRLAFPVNGAKTASFYNCRAALVKKKDSEQFKVPAGHRGCLLCFSCFLFIFYCRAEAAEAGYPESMRGATSQLA